MPKGLDTMQNDMADPDIRRFVDAINAAYAEHGAPPRGEHGGAPRRR